MLPTSCKCSEGCRHNFKEDDRTEVNEKFWSLSYNDRKTFLISSIQKCDVKRRRTNNDPLKEKRRGNAKYFLSLQGREIQVCQKFFLETLGYSSNQVLKTAMKGAGEIGAISDKRGKGEAENRTKPEIIDSIVAHIKSYDPEISHYRRAHAPNRLYLPSTLTILLKCTKIL